VAWNERYHKSPGRAKIGAAGIEACKGPTGLDLTQTIFEVIDMRSFSNLWFWIALAVVWSSASHWVLGVPWDLVTRAKRAGGEAVRDVETLAQIYASRLVHVAEVSGLVMTVLVSFVLTSLALLGFAYGVEFAQAVFLLGLPMTWVGWISLGAARRVRRDDPKGDDLLSLLHRHRIKVQAIGMTAIFVTTMWGMFKNFSIGVLGG
jgi:hypothetical protein